MAWSVSSPDSRHTDQRPDRYQGGRQCPGEPPELRHGGNRQLRLDADVRRPLCPVLLAIQGAPGGVMRHEVTPRRLDGS
jgi:hypothetical protein